MREPVYFYKSTAVRCKFNATMHTVLLVVHPGDLGLYYSHVTMNLYCDAAPRSGTSIHHADKADGVHATNFGDGL